MKGRVVLTVFLAVFLCLASTAFAEQVVEVWKYPWAGLEGVAASANDGSVWVASRASGSVVRLAPGLDGDLDEVVRVSGLPGAWAVATNSEDGSCWVGDCCLNQVVHLAADGTELSRTGGFENPQGISVDSSDGSCWVADRGANEVVRLAADGTELVRTYFYGLSQAIAAVQGTNSCWVGNCCYDQVAHLQDDLDGSTTTLSTASGFNRPESISVDSEDGTVWVADCYNYQVTHLQEDPDDYSITTLSTTPMSRPASVSAVPGGGAWVADICAGDDGQVIHLDDEGVADVTLSDVVEPDMVSVDGSDGTCWVLAWGNLSHVAATGETEQNAPGFYEPAAIAANPNDGSSWVADCDAHRVSHVTAAGEVVPFTEGFGAPTAIAVNPDDDSVWVIDWCTAQVIHLAADGTELWRTEEEFFYAPVSLAIDPADGSCWVADYGDYGDGCLVRLSADGEIVFQDCPPGLTAVAVDPNDRSVWLGMRLSEVPTAEPVIPEGDVVLHVTANPGEDPVFISVTSVPEAPGCLVVDPSDSSCLATMGGGMEPDSAALGGVAALDGGAYTFPVLRITETPSGAAPTTVTYLGGFIEPRGISVNPADRSIWVADEYEVGHMAADGAVLSRTGPYCCLTSVSVDTADGSCWLSAKEWGQVADLAAVPEAEFTASATSGVAPFEVSFTDLSLGFPLSWAWAFGDGGTSAEQNPTHTYLGGRYTVSLTIEAAGGSDTETKVNYIYCGAIAPTANFSATPTTGRAPLAVEFEDLSTNHPTEWNWNFGDGGSSTDQNPSHVYEERGTYSVSLVVANAQGFDIETKADYIDVQEPLVAAFSTDVTRVRAGVEVHFSDESTGGATSWLWNFGDGHTSTVKDPIHAYDLPGFYTVTLQVGTGGLTASVTKASCIAVGFTDVPVDDWAFLQEVACAEAGIVQGYWDGRYDPAGEVNRAQMATFIARALAGGDENVPTGPATPTFSDVGEDHWAYQYVEYCVDNDIVVGFWGGVYRPDMIVTRGQMAVFIARTVAVPTGMEGYVPPTTATFSDVTRTNEWSWAYKYVEYVAALDPPVVVGYQDETYRPQLTVTRDQMAVYMQRAFDLPIPGASE